MMVTDYPVVRLNTFFELFELIRGFKDRVAFSKKDACITYEKFCNDITIVYTQIKKMIANNVLIGIQDKYLFAVTYFATVLCGKVAALYDPEYEIPECINGLKNSITVDDEIVLSLIKLNESSDISQRQSGEESSEVCTLLCSSGTASKPKAIALSETNIITDLIAGMEKYKFDKYGVYVSVIPYSHAFGLVCDLLAPLYSCSTIYIPQSKLTFFSELPLAAPTALNISPGIVHIILAQLKKGYPKEIILGNRMTKILSGGAETSKVLCEEMRRYGIGVYGCYGLSECSPCVAVNRDSYYKDGSAGLPLNCNEIRIAEDSEICIKGTNVMLGYYDTNQIKKDAIVDGYYHTGDLGYIDKDGFLYITGRKSNMIVFENGVKLMPESMEMDIVEHTAALEAIVNSVEKNSKVMLRILVYLSDINASGTVKDYIKKKYKNYSIDEIQFTNEAFKKTSTGKIRRRL